VDKSFFNHRGLGFNQTCLTFMVFTEKYDLAVNLYTVPRHCLLVYSAVYVNCRTVHNNTALIVSLRFTMNSLYFDYRKT
jgi:hypothetical protein